MCWRNPTTLIYFELHLIPRWLLRSIFTLFPEQFLRRSWQVFHFRLLLSRCFWGIVLTGLEIVLQCGVRLQIYTHLKLLDRAVSGACFINWGVFEYDIAHRRSLAVLCMLLKIRHPLCGALPVHGMCQSGLHAMLWLHIGIPICVSSLQTHAVGLRDFYFLLSVPVERSCLPCINGVGLAGLNKTGPMIFCWPNCCSLLFYKLLFYYTLLSFY